MPHVLPIASVIAGFKPLDNVLWHIAKHIWDLIFSFATHSYYLEKPPSVKPLTAPYFSPSRALLYASARSLSLVSKSFREIVRRHLFSIVQIENSRRFLAFSHAINDNDTVGQLVRIFRVNFLRSSLGAAYDNRMTQILPALTES
ncbi:hypothetical protein BD410DRAFT_46603 [Rickenella mellea]|uniref:F-box domain-containing protein n=1 Tax=Rickenella mellea TaxID=50990 RepID=A0A4R5XHJ4_9AGAM|nr:hypothetical protein BD410DRAFT_46603 [Rickenella mellea]